MRDKLTNSFRRYTSLRVNYMTIPVYVVGAISLIIQSHFSDKFQQRALFLVGSAVPVVTGYLICVGTSSGAAGYVAMFILSLGMSSTESGNLCPHDNVTNMVFN